MDKYPADTDLAKRLDAANIFFFCIFMCELIFKVIGMGPKIYLKDQFNIFDAIVGNLFVVINFFYSYNQYYRFNIKLRSRLVFKWRSFSNICIESI